MAGGTRDSWSGRLAFILASIGAAVGLGNIWKFPYVAGQSGGSAFVLVYFIAVIFVALPILIAEIMLGRWGRQSPPNAMANVAHSQKRSKHWSLLGWTGMLTAYLIATYYSVISGWAVAYIFKNGGGHFSGQDATAVAAEFDSVHTIDRALRVGSVDRIIAAEALRPYVIDALERGIARHL